MTITRHPLSDSDARVMTQIRAVLAGAKGTVTGPEVRPMFDMLMSSVPAAEGVRFEHATLGGVPGWWVSPADPALGAAILYLHGGAYVVGSAQGYRNFAGQIAARAGVPVFVADYRLAPEHPFPAAVEDAHHAYDALAAAGFQRLAIVGDSAGGGLTLSLLSQVKTASPPPVAAVAMSPWTDLALGSASMEARDVADPLSSAAALGETARLYLAGHDPKDPLASPVHADRNGLPPVLIHTGEDEVLLDDTLRYVEGAPGSEAHVWEGLIHVFPSSFPALEAAGAALDNMGVFLRRHLNV